MFLFRIQIERYIVYNSIGSVYIFLEFVSDTYSPGRISGFFLGLNGSHTSPQRTHPPPNKSINTQKDFTLLELEAKQRLLTLIKL